jgi:hypothetical protein
VRYIYKNQAEEEILICTNLPTHTTGESILNLIDLYMAEMGLSWKKCVDICTDGAWLMVGKARGCIAHAKAIARGCTISHCIIHRQAVDVEKKNDSKRTEMALDKVVRILNFIKSRLLN